MPVTLLIHVLYSLFSCGEIHLFSCYCQLTTEKDKLFRLSLSLCMSAFVCLLGTNNSWYEAAWLIQAKWKIVRIITGFMEIDFAVMCSENIILQKDSLTVIHLYTETGFFPTVCIGIF